MKKITGYYRTGKYGTWKEFEIDASKKKEGEQLFEFCKNNIVTDDGKPVRELKDIKHV